MKKLAIFFGIFAALALGLTTYSFAQTDWREWDDEDDDDNDIIEPDEDEDIIEPDEDEDIIEPDEEYLDPYDDEDDEEYYEPDGIVTEPTKLVDPSAIKEFDEKKVKRDEEKTSFTSQWMQAPFITGHKNGIYALAGYGRMESTRVLDEGGIQVGMNYLIAAFGGGLDNDPDFYGSYSMLELSGRYGIMENLEAGLRLNFAGWDGEINVYNLPLNTEGGTAFGDMFIDAKYNLALLMEMLEEALGDELPIDVAALLTIKLPTGSQYDAISTGALDFSLNILTSYSPMENLGVHFMFGFTYAFDGDVVQPEATRTWGFLWQMGLGATYRVMEMLAVALQFEFYDPAMDMTLAFKGFFDLDGTIMLPELGFTIGLYTQAADFTMRLGTTILF